jgi:hypothetical protein
MRIPVPCLSCDKPLHQITISGIEVEACVEGCGGIWFDAAEIQRFNQDGEGDEDPELVKLLRLPAVAAQKTEKRVCIKCGEKMKEHEFRRDSGIFIDECYSCGGIWLDGGELKAIRESEAVAKSDQERADDEKRLAQKLAQARQAPARPGNIGKVVRLVVAGRTRSGF